MLNGRVDVIRRNSIAGWAGDTDDPDRVVEVAVYVDGVERGRYRADRPRPDLRALGVWGDGNHGFEIPMASSLSEDQDHEVIVRPLSGWGPLRRGHFRFTKNAIGEDGVIDLEDEFRPPRASRGGPARYVLHIGPHKTGTTYLQAAFTESRADLLAGGVIYPDASLGWVKPNDYSHTELVRGLAALETVTLPANFTRMNLSTYDTILLSSEDLAGMPGQSLRYLRSLIAARPVDIVFYCRRWSDLLPSSWQENVKQGSAETLPQFLAARLANPMKSDTINFDIVLDRYAKVFGIENIKIISYNHLVDANIDLYDHFVRSVLKLETVPPVARIAPNRALDTIDIETVRLLQQIAAMRSEPAGIDILQRYQRHRPDPNLSLLHAAMADSLASIELDDAAPGLRAVHELVLEKYRDCMVEPNSGYNLFVPATRAVPYVQSSYLLAEGVVQAAIGLYEALFRREQSNAA